MSHKIDWATTTDEIVKSSTSVSQGRRLDEYTSQGIYMLNYKPSDTPATDWSAQTGLLLVFYGWYDGVGAGHVAYFWQFYCVTAGVNAHRIYARHCTHKADGTFTLNNWTLIGP